MKNYPKMTPDMLKFNQFYSVNFFMSADLYSCTAEMTTIGLGSKNYPKMTPHMLKFIALELDNDLDLHRFWCKI